MNSIRQQAGGAGWMLTVCVIVLGCTEPRPRSLPTTAAVHCTDPRPEICTLDYRPVCAIRDTEVRCVTTPCDSTELATYSNACAACADPRVVSSTEGACEVPE